MSVVTPLLSVDRNGDRGSVSVEEAVALMNEGDEATVSTYNEAKDVMLAHGTSEEWADASIVYAVTGEWIWPPL